MIDAETDTYAWTATLRLADRFRLTICDASCLELAQRRTLPPLATLDKALGKAGAALSVALIGN